MCSIALAVALVMTILNIVMMDLTGYGDGGRLISMRTINEVVVG